MNVTGASEAAEPRRHDPGVHPGSKFFFHFLKDDIIILNLSCAERRRASQHSQPIRGLANKNGRIVATEIGLLLSFEPAKGRGPDAFEDGRSDAYLFVRYLDTPTNGSLNAASHGDGNHQLVFVEHWRPGDLQILGEANTGRSYGIVRGGSGSAD